MGPARPVCAHYDLHSNWGVGEKGPDTLLKTNLHPSGRQLCFFLVHLHNKLVVDY